MHQGESVVQPTVFDLLEEASTKSSAGDLMGAVESYGRAIDIDASSASAWYGMGVMQAKRGNTADAVAAFDKVLELNPHHAPTSANLAVLLEGSDSVRASELAKRALRTIPDLDDLDRIASKHPSNEAPILVSSIAVEEDEVFEEPPMLESNPVVEEAPLLQADPLAEGDEIPPLEAVVTEPVEATEEAPLPQTDHPEEAEEEDPGQSESVAQTGSPDLEKPLPE